MDALARDLLGQLHRDDISRVAVGDLTDVLDAHWSVAVNAKTHSFWAFRAFVHRLACTAEEYSITIEVRSDAWTSQKCPDCRSPDATIRHRDTLTYTCRFEGQADGAASKTFPERYADDSIRPMARPVSLTWNTHDWRPTRTAPVELRTTINEAHEPKYPHSSGERCLRGCGLTADPLPGRGILRRQR